MQKISTRVKWYIISLRIIGEHGSGIPLDYCTMLIIEFVKTGHRIEALEPGTKDGDTPAHTPELRNPENPGKCLATEPVKGTALPLESIDNVKRRNRLALRMLGVGDSVPNYPLKERLQYSAGLLVNH